MSYFGDILAVLKGDGIALDETEGALIGAPDGETISLYAAMEAKHGVWLARTACAVFSVLIQRHHCADQLIGAPMKPMNYARAIALLLAPIVLIWALIRYF
jgi:hypothetical protein